MKNRVACATPLQEMAPAVPKSVALGVSLRLLVAMTQTHSGRSIPIQSYRSKIFAGILVLTRRLAFVYR